MKGQWIKLTNCLDKKPFILRIYEILSVYPLNGGKGSFVVTDCSDEVESGFEVVESVDEIYEHLKGVK